MMKFVRGMAGKVAGAVFAFLMIIFMLTSVDWGTFTGSRTAGRVNGDRIDARVYEREVQRIIDARQRQTPASLGYDDYEQVRDEVWNEFVTEQLLRDEYNRRHIGVSDDEVFEAIRSNPLPEFYQLPEFQTDSQFDMAKYQKWLGSSVAQQFLPTMEAQYRTQIERAKLFRAITADVYLPDPALWERYRDEHERVKIRLAAVVSRTAVPDSGVAVTPAEIERYYREHRKELERPKTVFSSYVSVPRVPDASDTAAARARADTLRQEILAGTPFAEVAKRESADTVSGRQGGDLGEWTKGAFDPAFDSAAFSMPLRKLSEPVLSQFGFHLIEVLERKGNKAKARHVLVPIEITGDHRERLDAMADSLDRLATDRLDPAALDTVARALRLQIGTAAPLRAGDRMRVGILTLPDAGVWAARAKAGQISPIIETPVGMYVFRVDSIREGGLPPLDQIRDEVAQRVRDEKKTAKARAIAQQLAQRIDGGASLPAAADSLGLPHDVYGPLTRTDAPISSPAVVGAAFGVERGKHSGVIEARDGFYVLEVLDHTPADSAAFARDLEQFRLRALQEARQERVQNYVAGLRSTADIVDDRAKLFEAAERARATTGS
ncbi:MAG TPA: peptidyl-prolyl cis-trans isomerase [Gemmatimonadales bacterium]|nr:peptidyl-prolyl cis-trans isomerase [Gemmatimonadales bacterium]